jgi:hypothetical protein
MDPSAHHIAHVEEITSDNPVQGKTIRGVQEAPTPDHQSSIEHQSSDDAAGDEGIDEPAADE